jgi:hypothetical protein
MVQGIVDGGKREDSKKVRAGYRGSIRIEYTPHFGEEL